MALLTSLNSERLPGDLDHFERWVYQALEHLPLASAVDLGDCFGRWYTTSYQPLRNLEQRGLIAGSDVSVGRRKQRRYWIVEGAVENMLPAAMWRHPPKLIARLVENLVFLEGAYQLVGYAVREDPTRQRVLEEFRWLRERDVPYDALVRFNDGWMVLLWSGVWQERKSLRSRLERMREAAPEWRVGGKGARPGRYCFLVPDPWQAEMVGRVLREFGMAEISIVFVMSDRTIAGDFDLQRSRGWVVGRQTDTWNKPSDVGETLRNSVLTGADGRYEYQMLSAIEQWPGLSARLLAGLTRQNWKRTVRALDGLVEQGLIWCLDSGGYALSDSWLSVAARRDRVWNGRPGKLFGRERVTELYAGRISEHEKGLATLMARFSQAGCAIAPGWRGVEPIGAAGQLAPDGMVQLAAGPYGGGWHYVEYELRAQHPTTVGRKMRSYFAELRSDRCPVLVVCRPGAVEHFYEAGQGLELLVATVPDVRQGPVIGADGTVWKRFGKPVTELR